MTKAILICLSILLCQISEPVFSQQDSSRETFDFNTNWKFKRDITPWVFRYKYWDENWETVDLPHDWSIEGPFDSTAAAGRNGAYLPTGTGVYRKHFFLPGKYRNRKVFIEFDGVYMNAEVHCNGVKLGKRPFGYAGFAYDLTPWLNYGEKENIIAVLVDNSDQINSRWYSGSGIYRDVRLVVTNDIYIPQHGIFVYAKDISEKSAQLVIHTEVTNSRDETGVFTVKNIVRDPVGQITAEYEETVNTPPGSTQNIPGLQKIKNPQLWSVESPSMYKLTTEIYSPDGELLDRKDTPFGIRKAVFDKDRGFILNGNQMKIKGVCIHHDAGAVGSAVPDGVLYRRLKLLKDMGCNAIRTSHNPFRPSFYTMCDTMGLLVMDELFDEWTVPTLPGVTRGYNLYWDKWHEKDTRDFIRRDRNHPSVIIWSAGNEIIEQTFIDGYKPAEDLLTIFHELDPSRPVTSGNNMMPEANKTGFADVWDVTGYNYAPMFDMYEPDRAKYPGRKVIGTENTRGISTRGEYFWPLDGNKIINHDGYYNSFDGYHRTYGQEYEWKVTRDHDWIAGLFIWTGIDYLGEASGEWPVTTNQQGVLDRCGFPKDAYYFYQSQWNKHTDVLKILPHWNWKGHEGEEIPVWVYTNTNEVELFLNGKSLGKRHFEPNGKMHLEWLVKYEPGQLKAVGIKNDGRKIESTVETTSAPYRIRIEPDKTRVHNNGKDVVHLTLRVTDKEGRFVRNANIPFSVEIPEGMKLLGIDNGDPKFTGDFKQTQNRNTFNGMALVILQAGDSSGKFMIRVTGENIESSFQMVNIITGKD